MKQNCVHSQEPSVFRSLVRSSASFDLHTLPHSFEYRRAVSPAQFPILVDETQLSASDRVRSQKLSVFQYAVTDFFTLEEKQVSQESGIGTLIRHFEAQNEKQVTREQSSCAPVEQQPQVGALKTDFSPTAKNM